MVKKIALLLALALLPVFALAVQARNIELIDLPTANTLIKGEIRADFKFYPAGGILTRLYVALFDRLMIGGSINIVDLVSTGNLSFRTPGFLAKVRVTDDDGANMPSISIGYEAAPYSDVLARGAFFAFTKEVALGSAFVQFTGTVYTNEFTNFGKKIDLGIGAAFAITKEFTVGTEYDGIFGSAGSRHLGFSLGYFFDPIEIDLAVKYGFMRNDYHLSRILRIMYITYF